MTYPASIQTLESSLDTANASMLKTKEALVSISAASEAGPIKVQRVINATDLLVQLDIDLAEMQAQGAEMVDYAREQLRDPTLDVITKFTAVRNAGQSLLTWIMGAIPDGTPVTETLNDKVVDSKASTAALTEFRRQVGLFAATIS